jgi:hypothetical protein
MAPLAFNPMAHGAFFPEKDTIKNQPDRPDMRGTARLD